ncbi:MAG: hypothetical protein LC749_04275 [Actinobacteria bacterium]|nr:hypothetical protein [Actinomycetota bacterium]
MGVDLWWYLEVNEFARQTPWLHEVFAAYALWGDLVVLAGMLIAGYLVGAAPAQLHAEPPWRTSGDRSPQSGTALRHPFDGNRNRC